MASVTFVFPDGNGAGALTVASGISAIGAAVRGVSDRDPVTFSDYLLDEARPLTALFERRS